MKIKEVKLKNLQTSACLNLNYGTTKQKPKMQRFQKWWNFIKTSHQYPRKFNLGHFFSSIILPLFCRGRKRCSEEMGNFLLPGVIMIRTWERVLLGGMNKHEQIQFVDVHMYFPAVLAP